MTDRNLIVEEAKIRGVVDRDWWESPEEVAATEALLVRAGVLASVPAPFGEDAGFHYYRSKPHKWNRERTIARVLERTFETAGIPVDVAWEMTGQELMAATQRRDAERGLR